MDNNYFKDCVISELEKREIPLDDLPIDLMADIASEFFNMIEVKGIVYCGIESYLGRVYGVLLKRFIDVARLHIGERLSDVPELVAINNDIDEFLKYTKKYLGFEEECGGFVEVKEKQA